MRATAPLLALMALASAEAVSRFYQGHAPRLLGDPRPSHVRSSAPRSPPPVDSFTWGDVEGVNYLTLVKNQHLPQYCGSCWAQAATSSFSDRIKIARKAAWPDINIAPQVLVSCGPGDGCHGGDAGEANKWMHENGITDETCSIYQARGHDNGLPCSRMEVCETCDPNTDTCSTPPHFYEYRVDEFGDIEGATPEEQEANMVAEIYHRGPISCGIEVTKELVNYTGGIFYDKTGAKNINHDISVVGFGVDKKTGEKYWVIRNSWGTYWGENGFFRLRRGVNNLAIESGACSWATPVDSWSNSTLVREDVLSSKKAKSAALSTVDKVFHLVEDFFRHTEKRGRRRSGTCRVEKARLRHGPWLNRTYETQQYRLVRRKNLPKAWDWRDVNGTNYLSWTVNQHIPVYCGSCWAQGPLSALADRFIIADRVRYANLALSPQMVINCRAGGSCHGGNPGEVYDFAQRVGVVDMTCQLYDAHDNGPAEDCTRPDLLVCRDCTWPPPEPGQQGNCWAKEKFNRYHVSEYGFVSGADNIKHEIFTRGPIGCGLEVTEKFEMYQGGVFSQSKAQPEINHEISLVGWGVDETTGQEYWIGRNSWGTYWGEYGFFRIAMHENNMGIETECTWAVPKVE